MDKSLALAVETSGRQGSVAVGAGDEILAERTFSGLMRHSAELFVSVCEILERIGTRGRDIEHIYIAAGPGSFTGIRIAVTMAKMLALGCGAKIVAINTMNVIAANATDYIRATGTKIKRIGTILDAKRKEFYITVFDRVDSEWVKVSEDCLMRASEFIERFGNDKEPVWLLGEGLVYYRDDFECDGMRVMDQDYWFAKAKNVYKIGRKMAGAGQFEDAADLVPFYLRRPEALENWEKSKGCRTIKDKID